MEDLESRIEKLESKVGFIFAILIGFGIAAILNWIF